MFLRTNKYRLLAYVEKGVGGAPEALGSGGLYIHTHRSPKRPKTVLSGGRLREMTWWSQTNFFRDHLYHCYGFYLNRLDTPSSFSLISENQLIFRF